MTIFSINKDILIWVVIIIILYAMFKLMNKPDKDFEKEIEDILNSDKNKVKGQYD